MTTTTHTTESIHAQFGVSLLDQEYPELEVPIVSGNQRQGDVMILKVTHDRTDGAAPIGAQGVVVVRAETDAANTHTLYALTGECKWLPNPNASADLVQGWLTVPGIGEATLLHTSEHSAVGIGPGTYEIRRQQEFAGVWRRVAD